MSETICRDKADCNRSPLYLSHVDASLRLTLTPRIHDSFCYCCLTEKPGSRTIQQITHYPKAKTHYPKANTLSNQYCMGHTAWAPKGLSQAGLNCPIVRGPVRTSRSSMPIISSLWYIPEGEVIHLDGYFKSLQTICCSHQISWIPHHPYQGYLESSWWALVKLFFCSDWMAQIYDIYLHAFSQRCPQYRECHRCSQEPVKIYHHCC